MAKVSKTAYGKYIKKIREEKKLSRAELAKKLYVTEDAVGKWETGKRFPDFEKVSEIADALDVTVQEIYDNSKDEGTNNTATIVASVLAISVVAGAIVLGITHGGGREPIMAGGSVSSTEDIIPGGSIEDVTLDEHVTEGSVEEKTESFMPTLGEVVEPVKLELFTAKPVMLDEKCYIHGLDNYTTGVIGFENREALAEYLYDIKSDIGENVFPELNYDVSVMDENSDYFYLFFFRTMSGDVETQYDYDAAEKKLIRNVRIKDAVEGELIKFAQIGCGNYPLKDSDIKENTEILNPEKIEKIYMLKDYIMPFDGWNTKNATVEEGIWYKKLETKYVPSLNVVKYSGRSLESANGYFDKDNYYYPVATDRKNWIYMEDINGDGGWMYFEADMHDAEVMTEDGMQTMMNSFIFLHDGDCDENIVSTMIGTGMKEIKELLGDEDYKVITFNSYDELKSMLEQTELAVKYNLDNYVKPLINPLTGEPFGGKVRLYIYKACGIQLGMQGYYDANNDRLVLLPEIDKTSEINYILSIGDAGFSIEDDSYTDFYIATEKGLTIIEEN